MSNTRPFPERRSSSLDEKRASAYWEEAAASNPLKSQNKFGQGNTANSIALSRFQISPLRIWKLTPERAQLEVQKGRENAGCVALLFSSMLSISLSPVSSKKTCTFVMFFIILYIYKTLSAYPAYAFLSFFFTKLDITRNAREPMTIPNFACRGKITFCRSKIDPVGVESTPCRS